MKSKPAHAAKRSSRTGGAHRSDARSARGASSRPRTHIRRKRHTGRIVVLVVTLALVGGGVAYGATHPQDVKSAFKQIVAPFRGGLSASGSGSADDVSSEDVAEREQTAEQQQLARLRTAQIAAIGDMAVRSPIAPQDATGVLFHQASYSYALQMITELPAADNEACMAAMSVRVNHEQSDLSSWMDTDALHCWRSSDRSAMDTAVDVGAKPGTAVHAPVSGTVILVHPYSLYDKLDDIEIHIQPDGHPEMDCVILHTTDCLVAAGDHVEAGVTQLSSVRDIACEISGIQLDEYTPEDDDGNHAHVQINNADYEGYRLKKLIGAVLTGQESEAQVASQQAAETQAAGEAGADEAGATPDDAAETAAETTSASTPA